MSSVRFLLFFLLSSLIHHASLFSSPPSAQPPSPPPRGPFLLLASRARHSSLRLLDTCALPRVERAKAHIRFPASLPLTHHRTLTHILCLSHPPLLPPAITISSLSSPTHPPPCFVSCPALQPGVTSDCPPRNNASSTQTRVIPPADSPSLSPSSPRPKLSASRQAWRAMLPLTCL
ncbi:hypothetical protein NUW54_g11407 [Trametes sanguinea]|uniref:Uncharacterized protein n=1 Tax=Trametes sanguinea TaxID=158606 RepID=A0ACC1NG89_9APHY|nr:hypothetical protein NUW54_g11407 [Trametes sanguinea]